MTQRESHSHGSLRVGQRHGASTGKQQSASAIGISAYYERPAVRQRQGRGSDRRSADSGEFDCDSGWAIARESCDECRGRCGCIDGQRESARLAITWIEPVQRNRSARRGSRQNAQETLDEIGDGVIVNFVTPETVAPMLDNTRDGMRAAGKDPSGLDVVCRIICAVDEDEAVARTLFRRSLTAYVTVPQYNKFFREIGYEKEATIAIDSWNAGDRKKALETIPDEMVDKIFVFGSAEKCRRRLDDYARAGITTTALQFSSFARTPEERRVKVLRAIERLAAA